MPRSRRGAVPSSAALSVAGPAGGARARRAGAAPPAGGMDALACALLLQLLAPGATPADCAAVGAAWGRGGRDLATARALLRGGVLRTAAAILARALLGLPVLDMALRVEVPGLWQFAGWWAESVFTLCPERKARAAEDTAERRELARIASNAGVWARGRGGSRAAPRGAAGRVSALTAAHAPRRPAARARPAGLPAALAVACADTEARLRAHVAAPGSPAGGEECVLLVLNDGLNELDLLRALLLCAPAIGGGAPDAASLRDPALAPAVLPAARMAGALLALAGAQLRDGPAIQRRCCNSPAEQHELNRACRRAVTAAGWAARDIAVSVAFDEHADLGALLTAPEMQRLLAVNLCTCTAALHAATAELVAGRGCGGRRGRPPPQLQPLPPAYHERLQAALGLGAAELPGAELDRGSCDDCVACLGRVSTIAVLALKRAVDFNAKQDPLGEGLRPLAAELVSTVFEHAALPTAHGGAVALMPSLSLAFTVLCGMWLDSVTRRGEQEALAAPAVAAVVLSAGPAVLRALRGSNDDEHAQSVGHFFAVAAVITVALQDQPGALVDAIWSDRAAACASLEAALRLLPDTPDGYGWEVELSALLEAAAEALCAPDAVPGEAELLAFAGLAQSALKRSRTVSSRGGVAGWKQLLQLARHASMSTTDLVQAADHQHGGGAVAAAPALLAGAWALLGRCLLATTDSLLALLDAGAEPDASWQQTLARLGDALDEAQRLADRAPATGGRAPAPADFQQLVAAVDALLSEMGTGDGSDDGGSGGGGGGGDGSGAAAAATRWLDSDCVRQIAALAEAMVGAAPQQACCNNPRCGALAKLSEAELVGRGCICAGCRVARYCSPRCQTAHWRHHKRACHALRAGPARRA
ncbi:hypothetical protein HT031_005878 [Scenedesmus sp. PABB004]|nr:hypothetical protein HT031_005878 [Scenedesmus sp. PABB004]